jgi:hypothetical protein
MMERQILFDPNPTTASVPYAAKDKVNQLVPKDGTLAECRAVMMAKVSKCSAFSSPCPASTTTAWAIATITSILVEVSRFSWHQNEFLVEKNIFVRCKQVVHRTQTILQRQYQFTCICSTCQDSNKENDLGRMHELDESIFELGCNGRVSQAIYL